LAVGRMYPQTIDNAIAMLEKVFKNFEKADSGDEDRFVSILISRPGLGKSATIAKMAKRMGYDLVDLNLAQLDPTDALGLGAREKINGKWETHVALPQWVHRAMAGKCIILVDEFNMGTQDVLGSFQKMFSDFVIDGEKLPRTTHIIGACNPPGKDAIFAAKRLSGAFRRRLCMIPIIDDFEYVQKKHGFIMPRGFVKPNYEDIINYCSYDEISSAVVDNVFNIASYDGLKDAEKISLVAGFGEKALEFAQELDLFASHLFASSYKATNSELTYVEWKRNPEDSIPEYQQILWGQESIKNSSSYNNQKKFLSRIENNRVYVALYALVKEKFDVDYEVDEAKLPDSKEDPTGQLSAVGSTVEEQG